MPWKKMLAVVTGGIEESLLLRIEYLIEENRVLRNQERFDQQHSLNHSPDPRMTYLTPRDLLGRIGANLYS